MILVVVPGRDPNAPLDDTATVLRVLSVCSLHKLQHTACTQQTYTKFVSTQ